MGSIKLLPVVFYYYRYQGMIQKSLSFQPCRPRLRSDVPTALQPRRQPEERLYTGPSALPLDAAGTPFILLDERVRLQILSGLPTRSADGAQLYE